MTLHTIHVIAGAAGIIGDFALVWASWNFLVIPKLTCIARNAALREMNTERRLQPAARGNAGEKCLFD